MEEDRPYYGGNPHGGRLAAVEALLADWDERARYSGHCAHPQTDHPEESHHRCARNGGGNRSRPSKVFQPCPCACHFEGEEEEFECGNCGRPLKPASHWPLDEDGDVRYTHVSGNGESMGEFCS